MSFRWRSLEAGRRAARSPEVAPVKVDAGRARPPALGWRRSGRNRPRRRRQGHASDEACDQHGAQSQRRGSRGCHARRCRQRAAKPGKRAFEEADPDVWPAAPESSHDFVCDDIVIAESAWYRPSGADSRCLRDVMVRIGGDSLMRHGISVMYGWDLSRLRPTA